MHALICGKYLVRDTNKIVSNGIINKLGRTYRYKINQTKIYSLHISTLQKEYLVKMIKL